MSGFTTVNGAQVESQFIAATGTSQAVALSQVFASGVAFSLAPQFGISNAPGGIIVDGNSNDTITSAQFVLSTGGDSTLTVTSKAAEVFAAPGDTITASGADTLFGAVSGLTSFLSTGDNSSILGSTGEMAVTSSGANTTLIGGTGTNTMTVSGSNSLVVAGLADTVPGQAASSTTITLTETGTAGSEIATNPLAGPKQDLLATLSARGADTVIGGGGASTITGGGGDDVFGFVNGHAGGSEVIVGFTSSDSFAFGGYGYDASNIPTESYGTQGATGSDVITLTDGTTITLVGIDHKVF